MDQTTFWSLIERIDRGALESGDEDVAVAPLIDELSRSPEPKMHEFEDMLAQHLYDLDGQIYAEAADESGPSGDAVHPGFARAGFKTSGQTGFIRSYD